MAYRPSLIRPPIPPHPRALIEARMQRQALVKALADRLQALFTAVQQGVAASPPPGLFPTQAAAPPARPFPTQALAPPRAGFPAGPAAGFPSFAGSSRPVLPQGFLSPRYMPPTRPSGISEF